MTKRQFYVLFVEYEGDRLSELLGRLLPDLPANWRLETTTLGDVLARPRWLTELDTLILDLETHQRPKIGLSPIPDDSEQTVEASWIELLRLAGELNESLPVVGLISDEGPLRTPFASIGSNIPLEPENCLRITNILAGHAHLRSMIEKELYKAGRVENREAVLITHGTDTMAWAFAYLRYALSGLTSNMALTGSQLPLEGTFSLSDALGNLRTSVYLLNRLAPAKLFLVFNEGRHVYSGSLNKIRKWDQNAFDGRLAGAVGAEWVDFADPDWITIAYSDQKLERLHLIRTGGTIESSPSAQGSLEPTGDFVKKYLSDSLGNQFENLVDHAELNICRDSSNIALEDWQQLVGLIAGITGCISDTQFDATVKVIYANPFMTQKDYERQFEACQHGIVLAGYGAGNANTLEVGGRSVLPAIQKATQAGKLVALSSQVPLEAYDMDYQVGRDLVQAGGLPSGDLSLADAQIKLSFLCGHQGAFEAAGRAAGISTRSLMASAFLAGVKMRKKTSRAWLVETLAGQGSQVRIMKDDPFEGVCFEIGLQKIINLWNPNG